MKILILLFAFLVSGFSVSAQQLLTKEEAKALKKEYGKGVRRFTNKRTGTTSYISKNDVNLNSLAGKGSVVFRFKVSDKVHKVEVLLSVKGDYVKNATNTFEGVTLRIGSKKNTIKEVFVPMHRNDVHTKKIGDVTWTEFAFERDGEYGKKMIEAFFMSGGEKLRLFVENGLQFNLAVLACRGLTEKELERLMVIDEFRDIVIDKTKS